MLFDGSGAFLAVINIITRQGRDVKGVELSGEAGSLNTFKGRATCGNRWRNGLEALLSGTYHDSQGNKRLYYQAFDNPATNYGIAANRDHDSYYSFFGKAFFGDFTLTGVYHSREKLIPTGPWGVVFNDSSNQTLDSRAFLDLKYEHTFLSDWKLLARLYYDRYYYDGDYLYSFTGLGPARFVLNKDVGRSEWWGGELQVTKKLFDKHPIVAGAEVRHVFRQDQKNYNESPYQQVLDDQRSSWVGAVYAQGEFLLPKNFRLTAGLRYDYYSTFGSTLNPCLALVYTPWEKTAFKLLYGHGFRAPNAYELYWKQAAVAKANPILRPEKIKNLEFVWRQQLSNTLFLTTAAFYYRINDLITQVTDPGDGLLVYKNFAGVTSKGVEVELAGKWGKFLDGRLSYTLQEVKNIQTGQLLTNSPKHLVKANLSAPFYKDKLFGGLEVLYTSPRLTLSGRRVSGFAVTNFTLLSKNVSKNWEFSASVYNLFNNRYRDPAGEEHRMDNIRQDGIGFRVKALFRF